MINTEDKRLVNFVEENICDILNKCIRGDEEKEYTFTGEKGNTIDYVIGILRQGIE